MNDKDFTNRGVFFQPHQDQKLFGQGKLNIQGHDTRIVVVMEKISRDGPPLPVVYQRVGPLFANDKKGNENAPDRSGPMDTLPGWRMAAWKAEKDGQKYFTIQITERQQRSNTRGASPATASTMEDEWNDDDIPF